MECCNYKHPYTLKRLIPPYRLIDVGMDRTSESQYHIVVQTPDAMIRVPINYCPMCGRKLGE